MKINRILGSIVLATLGMLGAVVCYSANVSPTQKAQIEEVVKNYLMQNPEVIVQAVQGLQQKQIEQAKKSIQKTQETVTKYVPQIFGQATDPSVGNTKGTVVMTEFFDYQCPHCVAMTPVVEALVKSNSQLKVVFKEFPIRGPVSELAARTALAANLQGKYFEFHKALIAASQRLSEDVIYSTAKAVGLDVDKLKADAESAAIKKQVKDNIELAQNLSLIGTPAFFVAKASIVKDATPDPKGIAFIPGQIDQSELAKVIDKIASE